MSTIVRRVVAGFGANAVGQIVQVAIQLLSFPLFLQQWDAATYGVWLMLSATPAYLTMADVGMVTTAGNRMTMVMARGDVVSANTIFQSALALVGCICVGLTLLVVPLCLWAPLPGLSNVDERVALSALSLGVLIAPFGGLTEAIFRATGRYPVAATLAAAARLGEWGGSLLGLWLIGSFSAVAICGLAVRLIGTAAAMGWAGRRSQGLRWGLRHARRVEVRAMIGPSVSFMIFPLANALSLQGVTLLVGHFFGPALVTVFSAYRTLARVTVQSTSMLSFAVWPEFSRLFGHGSAAAVRPVYLRAELLGTGFAVAVSFVLYFIGPWLLRIWTHGVIAFEPALMGLLLTYAAVGGVGHMPRTLLMATNQHIDLARWSLAGGVAVLALAFLIGSSLGLDGIGLAMLITEAGISFVCLRLVREVLRTAPLAAQGASG
ncbi:Polysaccharide biosynthesis protein [Burkholderiales bacterium]|nr:Polysaccharide biosynthesis protein [Burkholderiales bacterium]